MRLHRQHVAGRGEPKYLSPEHIAQIKFVVQEAQKAMKLWIQDEYDYPSGFAGGKISEQYPELTMQAWTRTFGSASCLARR